MAGVAQAALKLRDVGEEFGGTDGPPAAVRDGRLRGAVP
jgi:hypothetical protein